MWLHDGRHCALREGAEELQAVVGLGEGRGGGGGMGGRKRREEGGRGGGRRVGERSRKYVEENAERERGGSKCSCIEWKKSKNGVAQYSPLP